MSAPHVEVIVRASRPQVLRAIRYLPIVAAHGASARSAAYALMTRMGIACLGRIRKAFLDKARGGSDETGLRWKPLSPKTIAYSRRHPRVPGKNVRARFAPSWMLTSRQRTRWSQLYSRYLVAFKGDKHHAAAAAWRVLKSEGAQTLIGTYGNTQVEILRDTGLLFNSLSPGVQITPGMIRPPRKANQIFRVGPGQVIIGTSRKWASVHHRGNAHVPQRRLWPEPARWPTSWWTDILEQSQQGVIDITIAMLGALP